MNKEPAMIRFPAICKVGLMCTATLWSGLVFAADGNAKDEVVKAAKSLEDKSNYSWKTTTTSPSPTQFRFGPTEGKTEKGGFTALTMSLRDNTIEAVLKGGKGAVKTEEGWRSLVEVAESDSQQNTSRFIARMLQNVKAPAAQAADLASKAKELKKTDDAYVGDLTQEGVKELLSFGRRPNPDSPGARDVSGAVKFWIKDGVLSKYEYQIKGTVKVGDNDFNMDRTSTIEIKDVDSTKIDVPEEAKSKASS
jgi:hypothetical protein